MTTATQAMILTLLASRANKATVCPSEVARALAARRETWRDVMPAVHGAVDHLLAEGRIELRWKGRPLEKRAGPYRIALLGASTPRH